MNQKRIESFLNKNFGSHKTEDNLAIYDLDEYTFIILGSEDISFYLNGRNYNLDLKYVSGIEVVDNRLNFHFWDDENSEKTLSINLSNTDDYFISARLSEAIFKIDVDDPRIKRFFVRATDKGSALRSIRDQYPEIAIVGVSKFSESKNKEDIYVGREAISNIFQVYSSPDTDRIIRMGIDWTMSNLFGSNWPLML